MTIENVTADDGFIFKTQHSTITIDNSTVNNVNLGTGAPLLESKYTNIVINNTEIYEANTIFDSYQDYSILISGCHWENDVAIMRSQLVVID